MDAKNTDDATSNRDANEREDTPSVESAPDGPDTTNDDGQPVDNPSG